MVELGTILKFWRRPWILRLSTVKYESVESNSTIAANPSARKESESSLSLDSKDVHKDSRNEPLSGREWIRGVVACAWVVSAVLLINIILVAIAAGLAYGKNGAQGFSSASMYQGNCKTAKYSATGIHLVINILSTVMLGASNYCMQCLASPSRAEVDEAHRQRSWLSIGIPNIIDLLVHAKGRRRILGSILLIMSLPFHLIYNSVAYYSLGPNEYGVALAKIDWSFDELTFIDHSADYSYCNKNLVGLDTAALQAVIKEGKAERLSNQECMDAFAQDYVSGKGALFLMTKETMPEDAPLLYVGIGNDVKDFNGLAKSLFGWICGGQDECMKADVDKITQWNISGMTWTAPYFDLKLPGLMGSTRTLSTAASVPGDVSDALTSDMNRLQHILGEFPFDKELQAQLNNASNWANSSWAESITIVGRSPMCGVSAENHVYGVSAENHVYEIDHCLAVPTDERCQLFFSPPICIIIVISTVIKLVCMLLTARDDRDEILLTVGDAISSFITHPDPTTEGAGLISKPMLKKADSGWQRNYNSEYHAIKQLPHREHIPEGLPEKKLWFHAVSRTRWVGTVVICAVIIGVAGLLLHLSIVGFKDYYKTDTIWNIGLGKVTAATLITSITRKKEGSSILGMILLANTPQLIVSIAYFMYNALMTCMVLAAEYDDYAIERKYLRVSWPRGNQRSTYYLSLPYRYSMPLLGVSALLHWLVSQSIFFVEIVPFDRYGKVIESYSQVTCGYSPVAIVFAMLVGGLLILGSGLLGLRPFRSRMPLAVHCSAAISAACHPITKKEHALEPIQWGETSVHILAAKDNPIEGETDKQDALEEISRESQSQMALESSIFHCSFTSEEVQRPSPSRLYI